MKIQTREQTLAKLTAAFDECERLVGETTGPGTLFEHVLTLDHKSDVNSELVRHDPALLVEISDHLETGNEEAARELIQLGLMKLASVDPDLFEKPMLWQELYRLVCEVEGGDVIDEKTNRRLPFDGKIGKPRDDHRFYACRDYMDTTQRRRRQYELRKMAKAKAKKKG